jgi:hypothetical protein
MRPATTAPIRDTNTSAGGECSGLNRQRAYQISFALDEQPQLEVGASGASHRHLHLYRPPLGGQICRPVARHLALRRGVHGRNDPLRKVRRAKLRKPARGRKRAGGAPFKPPGDGLRLFGHRILRLVKGAGVDFRAFEIPAAFHASVLRVCSPELEGLSFPTLCQKRKGAKGRISSNGSSTRMIFRRNSIRKGGTSVPP